MSTSTRVPVVDAVRGKTDAGLQTFGEMIVMAIQATQVAEPQRLADDLVEALPPLLRDFARLTDIFARRDPHVRELLIQFPIGLQGLVGAFEGGRMQTNMLTAGGEVCSYGVEDANPQLDETERQSPEPDRRCPKSFDGQQRGSAHAPGPVK